MFIMNELCDDRRSTTINLIGIFKDIRNSMGKKIYVKE